MKKLLAIFFVLLSIQLSAQWADPVHIDSLVGTNADVIYSFNSKYRTVYLTLQDTGTVYTDSLKVSVYNYQLSTWTTIAVGLYDLYNQQNVSGTLVIPGAGVTKKYWLLDEFIRAVKIEWYYGNNKIGRKCNVVLYGSN